MMITTWRILWIPDSGAILIFNVDESAARLWIVAGASARHCSVRPVVNVCGVEKLPLRVSRGRATVVQRAPLRRWSEMTCPARAGSSSPLSVSLSPATANVAVLVSVTTGRTSWVTVRLFNPVAVTRQSRLVVTVPAGITKLYDPDAVVSVRAMGLNRSWFGYRRHSTIASPQRLTPRWTPMSDPNTRTCATAVTGLGAAYRDSALASAPWRCCLACLQAGDGAPGAWPLDGGASATAPPARAITTINTTRANERRSSDPPAGAIPAFTC